MSKKLNLRNTASNPLSEEQIVEATIAYANGTSMGLLDAVPRRESVSSNAATKELLSKMENFEPTDDEAKESKAIEKRIEKGGRPVLEKMIEDARKALIRGHLQSIVSGEFDAAARTDYLEDDDFFSAVSPRLYLKKTPMGISVSLYYGFADLFSVVKLGSFFLDDSERDFGKKLCQCRLESCGKFFFEIQPPRGAPQRKYCCKEHMTDAHNQGAKKRMVKHRSKSVRKPK